MTRRARKEAPSFEGALARLEEIVEHLEGGELGLEEALAVFEEGVALSRRCSGQLEEAERRIEILTGEEGALAAAPLETTEEP
jgi:exodeoxyribonuclease VII small subunit